MSDKICVHRPFGVRYKSINRDLSFERLPIRAKCRERSAAGTRSSVAASRALHIEQNHSRTCSCAFSEELIHAALAGGESAGMAAERVSARGDEGEVKDSSVRPMLAENLGRAALGEDSQSFALSKVRVQ